MSSNEIYSQVIQPPADEAYDVQELSANEMDAVAGGAIMDIIVRAWMNAECLKRLTREGTVIDCSYPARL
jgi:hypothetical protein